VNWEINLLLPVTCLVSGILTQTGISLNGFLALRSLNYSTGFLPSSSHRQRLWDFSAHDQGMSQYFVVSLFIEERWMNGWTDRQADREVKDRCPISSGFLEKPKTVY
jgi:hypothetical protein